jgi:hypothetical protein
LITPSSTSVPTRAEDTVQSTENSRGSELPASLRALAEDEDIATVAFTYGYDLT